MSGLNEKANGRVFIRVNDDRFAICRLKPAFFGADYKGRNCSFLLD